MTAFLLGTAALWTLLHLWALLYTVKEVRESRVRWKFARRRKYPELDRYSTRDYRIAKSLSLSLFSATLIGVVVFAGDMRDFLQGELTGDVGNVITRTLFMLLALGIANAVRIQKAERARRV